MDKLAGDLAQSIYKKSDVALDGEFSMSGKMLELLMLLDGRTNLRVIAQKMGIHMTAVRPLLSTLITYGVIEKVPEADAMIAPKFFGYMAGRLSRITGPIAKILVQDAISEISGGSSGVPEKLSAQLIELVAQQISDEGQRAEFVQNMLDKLKVA